MSEALTIGLVLTGGTVGSEYASDDVVRIPASHTDKWGAEVQLLAEAWGDLGSLEVRPYQPLRVLSENMVPENWPLIASAVRAMLAAGDVAGVIVLHGTDTMAYTTAALALMLQDVQAPVVVTGSNLPPNQANSDALTNIRDALIALNSLRHTAGVYLSFAGAPDLPSFVHVATCVRKVRASGQAFFSINRAPVARVENREFVWLSDPPPSPARPVKCEAVDSRVLGIRLYPGIDLHALWGVVEHSGVRGVVIELYASGTGPDVDGGCSLPTFVTRCTSSGVPVFGCLSESAEQEVNLYDSSVSIAEAGLVLLDDVIPETAIVKLMWALSAARDSDEVTTLMLTSMAGERARTKA